MAKDNLIVGNWVISRKPYEINRKPSPGGVSKGVRVKIGKLSGE